MVRRLLTFGAILTALAPSVWAGPRPEGDGRLDRELRERAATPRGHSRVIVHLTPGASASTGIRELRGTLGRRLASVDGQVAEVPDSALAALSHLPGVRGVSLDRRVQGTLELTGATIGATWVRDSLGFDGTGVGIAVIDSGVANWHDDLGSERVTRFVDFVNFQPAAYDDYGHGTHVAGILAGNGHDSGGRRRGVAPGATLLVEKVLDAAGQGFISNVIAAIDYAIANKDALHLRVINLSVAAAVSESYNTDPLTLAAKRAVEAGLVVVSAAGNLGRGPDGKPHYGAIAAPGNAPWVITVGASSHNGTVDRSDDTVAAFSSRGPTPLDREAKPDLVAPGVDIESIAEAGSTLFNTKPLMRLWGTVPTANEPYLSLSGTSMASPVVSGTIALMLQANPSLTPNLVKAILQFTAETREGYNPLTQGGGFLNARGAVELAQSLTAGAGANFSAAAIDTDRTPWSRHVIWGNRRIGGGQLSAVANAWRTDVMWGSGQAPDGKPIVLGTASAADGTPAADNTVWSAACGDSDCDDVVWGTVPESDGVVRVVTTGDEESGPSSANGSDAATGFRAGTIVRGTNVLDETDNVMWSASAIRRRSRMLVSEAAQR